ncbi:MAG TPA: bifunctional phosphopantothenoylcysteine decarboxylase/phosphopantothenate--cysteine ligase CoaBC [Blastocatellia bacterium]|jgi:phosphopantothenoylcysteine decarboxylase/phosphopantothenate--cysteine ligase|nr:bifunctional phosphopantothenoylcysteine decarboxylase/phosphopantothenate--cysteine ligase CoaBC [Blastocatellia bacterium]
MKIALGVTGCIAAYKAVEVMRGLQKRGAAVQVIMTSSATRFVAPLTFQAISGYPVISAMFAPTGDPEIKHIQIAQSVDLLLVAPATANALAKFAHGIADDFLSTLYISSTAPVLVAPAMNVEMWAHPATQENVRMLRERGVHFVDPGEGYLACRTVGAGRLAEPEEIVARAIEVVERGETRQGDEGRATPLAARDTFVARYKRDLAGEHVLITAGPTYEAIDPVRGVTNRSSGRMGYAIAEAAEARGARVTLVSGPVALEPPRGVDVVRVRSAFEMYTSVMERLPGSTIVVMAAAVADYRPVRVADQKIKKSGETFVLEMERTEDILAAAAGAREAQVLVGFAAETQNVVENARKKLAEKGCDLIVANDVSAADAGFDVETNRITLVTSDSTREVPLISKREAADLILQAAIDVRSKQTSLSEA